MGDLNLIWYGFDWVSPLVGKLEVTDKDWSDIQVYPNPVNDYLFIKIEESIEANILSIYDVAGRLVLEKKVNEDEKILGIDLKDFTTGLYRIDITDTKGKRYGKTVMVE